MYQLVHQCFAYSHLIQLDTYDTYSKYFTKIQMKYKFIYMIYGIYTALLIFIKSKMENHQEQPSSGNMLEDSATNFKFKQVPTFQKVKTKLQENLDGLNKSKKTSWLPQQYQNQDDDDLQNDCQCQCSYQKIQATCRNICISRAFNVIFIILMVIFLVSCVLWDPVMNVELSQVAAIIQIVCHCLFIIMFVIKFIEWNNQNIFWLMLDIFTSLAGIIGYGLQAQQYSEISRYFKAFRTLKLIFLIKQIPIFEQPAHNLLSALRKIGNILIPAIVLLYIYSVVGLYAFTDYQYTKCRDPANQNLNSNWTVYSDAIYLCGERSCPIVQNVQYQCLNPIDYNVTPDPSELVNIDQGYGLLHYQNIFYAILSTFKQIFVTGSSRLIILHKQAINQLFVEIYYYSFIYLKSYIYLNIFYSLIILASWDSWDKEEVVSQDGGSKKLDKLKKDDKGNDDSDEKPAIALDNDPQSHKSSQKMSAKVTNTFYQQSNTNLLSNPNTFRIQGLTSNRQNSLEFSKPQKDGSSINKSSIRKSVFNSGRQIQLKLKPEQKPQQKSGPDVSKMNFVKGTQSSSRRDNSSQYKIKIREKGPQSKNNNTQQNSQTQQIQSSPRGQLIQGNLVLNNARIYNVFEEVNKDPILQNDRTKELDLLDSKLNNQFQDSLIHVYQQDQEDKSIQQDATLQQQSPQLYRIYEIINNIIIVLCCINLSLDFQGQSSTFKYTVDCLDFAFYWLFFVELVGKVLWERVKLRRIQFSTKLDILIFLIVTAGVIYQAITATSIQDFLQGNGQIEGALRSFKYLRVVLMLFRSTFFTQARLILQSTFRSLYNIKHVVGLWLLIVLIFAIIGFHLHSYKSKINQKGELSVTDGQSFQISFDGIFNSVIFTMLTFYNQQWDYLMFQQYLGGGALVVIWQLISIIVGLVLFSKYFMALFMVELDTLIDNSVDTQKLGELLQSKQEKQDDQLSQGQQLNNSNRINDSGLRKQTIRKTKLTWKGDSSSMGGQQVHWSKKVAYICRRIVQHVIYKIIFVLMIIFSCIVLIQVHPHYDRSSTEAQPFLIIDKICKSYFMLDLIINLIAYGIWQAQTAYFRKSYLNWLNVIIIIIEIISFSTLGSNYIFLKIEKIKVLRVTFFVELQYKKNWNMRMTVLSFMQLLPKVLTLLTVTIIMYSFFALILVKVYKNYFYSCQNYFSDTAVNITTKSDCFDWGGDWIQMSMNTGNLFNSTLFLFLVATTQGWIMLMQPMMNFVGEDIEPVLDTNKYISIFFVCFFFFGNLIMLNVFVGLSVSNFKRLKQILTGESKLSKRQKMWLSTKQQIYKLEPVTLEKRPSNCIRGFAYDMATRTGFKIAQGFIFITFLIVMSLYYSNMSQEQRIALQYVQYAYIGILLIEYIIQSLAFGIRTDHKKQFIFKNMVVAYAISYMIIIETASLEKQYIRIMGGLFIAIQLIRYLSLLDEIPFAKKLLNSLVTVLPETSNIMLIIFVTIFIYAIIGMQLFSFLKPSAELDSFNQNYTRFGSALFALIKFSTMESPINQISDAAQELNPNFICNTIDSYEQYLEHGQTGCGSKALSYIFFLSFHVLYSLLLMSTLMAIITDSYSTVLKEENAKITKFVLYKVQKAWSRFDPKASGYIPYRQFWMFTAQLLQIYGGKSRKQTEKSLAQLFASKEEFLKSMSISIYENQEGILCFQFNQVIEALTKAYLKDNWGTLKSKKADKMFKQRQANESIAFKKSMFTSSHVATLIILKSGLKHWRKLADNTGEVFKYGDAMKKFNSVQKN